MLTIFFALFFGSAQAAEFIPLLTPRGETILVTSSVPAGGAVPLVVFAPGQGCGERPLYDVIGQEINKRGWAFVRFQYAYCVKDAARGQPSENLNDEAEDFATALAYAQKLPGVDASRLALAGKSLGSLVSYRLFRQTSAARTLALLTPVCTYTTDDNDKPLPEPRDVFAENYPDFGSERRPVVLPWGENDDLCLRETLLRNLRKTKGNYLPVEFPGDHGFNERNDKGEIDEAATAQNIRNVAEFVGDFFASFLDLRK